MEEFLKAVQELVERLFAEGHPGEIRHGIRLLAKKYKISRLGLKEADKILRRIQNTLQDDFIKKFTKDLTVENVENITDKFEKGVLQAVRRGMRSSDPDLAMELVKSQSNVAKQHLRTTVDTAKAGITQAQKLKDIGEPEYFKLVGPKLSARSWCAEHVGKIYHISEIQKMDNGQGLPVLYFAGGYNCRHRWVAVAHSESNGGRHI